MDIISERRLISLNSEDATQYFNSTFLSNLMFNFSDVLKDERNILYVEGGIYNCQIPCSFYAVNYSNNVLYYSLNSIIYSVTVPVGNYNFTNFASQMVSKFLANGHVIVITIDKTTGIITFTNSTGTLNYFRETGSTIWRVLGFATGSGNFNATANVITPPYLLNLLGIKKLKISSNALGINSLDSKSSITNTLIDTLGVNTPAYGLLTYDNQQAIYSKLKQKTINQIDIQIKDENNSYVNFNNTDWSITLALIIYRKLETTNTDLQEVIDTLGNIVPILEQVEKNTEYLLPPEDLNLQNTQNQENAPIDTNGSKGSSGPDFIGVALDQPILEDVGDLDLLLYENPKI